MRIKSLIDNKTKVVKNRLSRDNVSIGLIFLAEAGSFEELPKSSDISFEDIARFNKITER